MDSDEDSFVQGMFEGGGEEEEDTCGICLDRIVKRGAISCDHLYCFDCIKQWSEVTNQCPMCKKRFREIRELDPLDQLFGEENEPQAKRVKKRTKTGTSVMHRVQNRDQRPPEEDPEEENDDDEEGWDYTFAEGPLEEEDEDDDEYEPEESDLGESIMDDVDDVERRARQVALAMGGKAVFIRPCICH